MLRMRTKCNTPQEDFQSSFLRHTLYCKCVRPKCHNDVMLDIVNHVTVDLRKSVTQNHEHQVSISFVCCLLWLWHVGITFASKPGPGL